MRPSHSRLATTMIVGLLVAAACGSAPTPVPETTRTAAPQATQTPAPPAKSPPSTTTPPTSPPPDVIPIRVAIAAGGLHSCSLTTAGRVKCWGLNQYGQAGDRTTYDDRLVPGKVSGLGSGVIAISAGYMHTCALTSGGGVKCWGWNLSGALGNSTPERRNSVPVDVAGLDSGISAISAGGGHTCALTSGGGVKCWGRNVFGALGDGTTTDSDVPVDVTGLAGGVIAISAGNLHTCALTNVGGVKCWGTNHEGRLGNGTTTDSSVPVDVSGLASGVIAISAASWHTCALTSSGQVKCWGELHYSPFSSVPIDIDVSGVGDRIIAISAGYSHDCALTSVGGVKCWGQNSVGQLGNGTTTHSLVPLDVSGLTRGVSEIAAGGEHTCALTSGGRVSCWGRNERGQLGDGTTGRRSRVPVDVLD